MNQPKVSHEWSEKENPIVSSLRSLELLFQSGLAAARRRYRVDHDQAADDGLGSISSHWVDKTLTDQDRRRLEEGVMIC
jgi:hypothetical protein